MFHSHVSNAEYFSAFVKLALPALQAFGRLMKEEPKDFVLQKIHALMNSVILV